MRRANSLEKTLMLGKIEGRRRGQQRTRWLDSITESTNVSLSKPREMWELDHKEGWAPKNWCFWTVVLEKILENPLDSKKIKSVHPKGNQHWIFTGRTDAEADTAVLWSPDVKSWLIGKDPDAGKDRGQEGKRVAEDEMVEWHHQLNGHESEQTLEDGDGQGGLGCRSPCGSERVEYDWATERQQPHVSDYTEFDLFNLP